MTPQQKKAHEKVKKAISELCEASEEDGFEALNAAVELLARAAGTLIGTTVAMHGAGQDAVHTSATLAGRHIQKHAAESYGMCLAHDQHAPTIN